MSPVGTPKNPYVENEDHVPSPTALRGTFETSGTSGAAQYDYDAVVPVFAIARDAEKGSPSIDGSQPSVATEPEVGPARRSEDAVPSAGVGDQTVVTGTLDTTGTGEPQSPEAPKVEEPEEGTSVGGDPTEGAGSDTVLTQGTVDTTGTDEPTTPSAEVEPNPEPVDGEGRTVDEIRDAANHEPEPESEPEHEPKPEPEPDFSPIGRTLPVVEKYLADASPEERKRVLDIERSGSNPRKTLLEGKFAEQA